MNPDDKIAEERFELYSFDIFDTLITRRAATPCAIFSIMEEKIKNCENLDENLKNNFRKIRSDSEFYAREDSFNKNLHREINLDRIYDKIQNRYKLDSETISYLKDLELETERENLLPIEENITLLKNLLEKNKRVILISDMYFSEIQLKNLLTTIDSVFSELKIYVSSEYKCSKYDSKLFSVISKEENVQYKNWKHTGDNEISDYKNAKKLGICAELFPFPKMTAYENALIESNPCSLDYQYLIGYSKYTRLSKKHKNQNKYEFGASFAGEFLYNYVNYILEKSLKNGFKTLHFISRDGYIPKLIADIIINKRKLDIKTKYIYGSRQAWRIPTENNYNEFISDILKEYPQKVSVSYLAYRLHINSEKISEILGEIETDKKFPPEYNEEIQNKLSEDEVKNYIISENRERKNLLIRYIREEIDFSEKEIVFVDATGSGKSQDILTEIIRETGEIKTYGFYLATSGVDNSIPNSYKDVYLTEPKPHYHYTELLCRTNTVQTLGYKESEGKAVPAFEDVKDNPMDLWGFEDYLQGICDFVNNITEYENPINNPEICYTYIDFMTTKCDKNVAEVLGSMPVSTIGKEGCLNTAAPKLDIKLLLYMIFTGKKHEDLTEFPYLIVSDRKSFSDFISGFQIAHTFVLYLKLFFVLLKYRKSKILFWGASLFLEEFFKVFRLNFKNILGIIDKNPARQGKNIWKYRILSPEEIKKIEPDFIILSIKNKNKLVYSDIQKFLSEEYPKIKLLPNIFV